MIQKVTIDGVESIWDDELIKIAKHDLSMALARPDKESRGSLIKLAIDTLKLIGRD